MGRPLVELIPNGISFRYKPARETEMQNTGAAQDDGYVECGECGHCIEQHGKEGCEICDCAERWTVKEIMRVRRREGLPGEWRNR